MGQTQMDQRTFLQKPKAYRMRTLASGLAPGVIEKASEGEVTNCYVEVIHGDAVGGLPERFWFNLMKGQSATLTAQADWRAKREAVFAFTDLQVRSDAAVWDKLPVNSARSVTGCRQARVVQAIVARGAFRSFLEGLQPRVRGRWRPSSRCH